MKRYPIAAKIGILSCCVFNDFFTQGYECLPDLCNLAYMYLATILCVPHVTGWQKKKIPPPPNQKKLCVTTPILKPTDDQKQS